MPGWKRRTSDPLGSLPPVARWLGLETRGRTLWCEADSIVVVVVVVVAAVAAVCSSCSGEREADLTGLAAPLATISSLLQNTRTRQLGEFLMRTFEFSLQDLPISNGDPTLAFPAGDWLALCCCCCCCRAAAATAAALGLDGDGAAAAPVGGGCE